MSRHGRHITLDDLPPAYREQAERQLRGAVAGSEPRHVPARPAAPVEARTAPLQGGVPPCVPAEAEKPARRSGRHKEPTKTEARFNRERLGSRGMFEALTFHVEGGAYTPDFLVIDHATGAPTVYEVKGSFGYPSENRARFAFLTCRARFPFVRFRWFRLLKGGRWAEEYAEDAEG